MDVDEWDEKIDKVISVLIAPLVVLWEDLVPGSDSITLPMTWWMNGL
jgi:hypothetical protein